MRTYHRQEQHSRRTTARYTDARQEIEAAIQRIQREGHPAIREGRTVIRVVETMASGLAGCSPSAGTPGSNTTGESVLGFTPTTSDQPSTPPSNEDPGTSTGSSGLSLSMAVDFGQTGAQQAVPAGAGQPTDGPYPLTALTPTAYAAAFQRLSAVDREGNSHDWFTSPTLGGSLVVDFTADNANHAIGDLPIGIEQVQRLEMVIYYLQLRVPIGGQARTIRIYLSDDEVTGEGQHHQGDMTEVDDSGTEAGWLTAPYFEISPVRTIAAGAQDAQGDPVSVDPVTGHQRGLFGDLQLWNVGQTFNKNYGREVQFRPDAVHPLRQADWPDNVSGLRAFIQRLIIGAEYPAISISSSRVLDHLKSRKLAAPTRVQFRNNLSLLDFEYEHCFAVWDSCDRSFGKAIKVLDVGDTTLRSIIYNGQYRRCGRNLDEAARLLETTPEELRAMLDRYPGKRRRSETQEGSSGGAK